MTLVEIQTATIPEKGQIAITKSIRKLEGFTEGSKIAILTFDDHVELRPMQQVSERLATAIASESSLAKDWKTKKEDKAWKDL